LGYYFSLAQVGLEMVVPIGLGVWLQDEYGFRPWGVVVGAALGLIVGLTHLVVLSNRQNATGTQKPSRDEK
jgi:F0F1-type ATP synthase assembly protein I